ncbi:hypothetical protein [Bradyrhizobium sp. Arg816]|uniref:hypothetical protein n=1 Tax=Bradyrhizobium sp. Arg816 TaxID=2998491 RepID=UPI00249F465E|nr:hypothetical protein [Bradyrhizobium sp. Arg816]MDI3565543.1 hypothetical protein [Bradyrhizobium sp. Arg816]
MQQAARVVQKRVQLPSVALRGIENLECFTALLDGWLGAALLIGCRFATGQQAVDQQCRAKSVVCSRTHQLMSFASSRRCQLKPLQSGSAFSVSLIRDHLG